MAISPNQVRHNNLLGNECPCSQCEWWCSLGEDGQRALIEQQPPKTYEDMFWEEVANDKAVYDSLEIALTSGSVAEIDKEAEKFGLRRAVSPNACDMCQECRGNTEHRECMTLVPDNTIYHGPRY